MVLLFSNVIFFVVVIFSVVFNLLVFFVVAINFVVVVVECIASSIARCFSQLSSVSFASALMFNHDV